MKQVIFTLIFLSLSISVQASRVETPRYIVDNMTSEQVYLLKMAHHVGAVIGLPETLQALLLQETMAGKFGRVNWGEKKVAFGVTQVRPETAREMIEKYRRDRYGIHFESLSGFHLDYIDTDLDALEQRLKSDDMFALVMAALVVKEHQMRTDSWRQLVVSYFEGVAGSKRFSQSEIDNHFYFEEVATKLQIVRLFNQEHPASPLRVASSN